SGRTSVVRRHYAQSLPQPSAAETQTKRNRYLSKNRYVVEQSFGTLHRKFRYARAAYFGLIKVSAQSHLKAMCLNLLKAANRLSAPVAA
ncbi:transposase DDE domain protein, partial [Neisseria meningitidis 96037]